MRTKVWITRPVSPADELAGMGIPYAGEEDYSREVLIHEGVPAQAIRILPETIVDTQQEVEEISRDSARRRRPPRDDRHLAAAHAAREGALAQARGTKSRA